MAHAFDNRNFIPGRQQTFYSVVSPSSRPDITNVLWETSSSSSPKVQSSSPQSSPKPNHPPPSYEESIFNKALANRQNSQSSLHSPSFRYHSNYQQQQHSSNPIMLPFVSYSSPSTPNDSFYHPRQQQSTTGKLSFCETSTDEYIIIRFCNII